jgi:hypothetical protein
MNVPPGWSLFDEDRNTIRLAGRSRCNGTDLTIVPEGNVSSLVWHEDRQQRSGRPLFIGSGRETLPTEEVSAGLAQVVGMVLNRLNEQGVTGTLLHEEWSAVTGADEGEVKFCRATARLGADPYSLPVDGDYLVELLERIDSALRDDFLDNVDLVGIEASLSWLQLAEELVLSKNSKLKDLAVLRVLADRAEESADLPWRRGYAMAQRVRSELKIAESAPFPGSEWVSVIGISLPAHGLRGLADVSRSDQCAVVLPGNRSESATLFAQARVLGRALATPESKRFLLSRAKTETERTARAFAAELLAPAAGLKNLLADLGEDEEAFELAADVYGVSPMLVKHQYDNRFFLKIEPAIGVAFSRAAHCPARLAGHGPRLRPPCRTDCRSAPQC